MRLEVSCLSWSVRSRQILHEVDLEVGSGEFVTLLGPNGCGKTSLLRCLYRLQRPTHGRATLNGADIWQMPLREVAKIMAVLTQLSSVEFDFTVAEMVAMGRIPHRNSFQRADSDDERIIANALHRCRLADLAERTFATLSGGEKQRVLIARAVAQQPLVLVMDEPTNHLDIRAQAETLQLVRGLGITVLAALHDLNLASRVSDRVVMMSQGRVVAAGVPSQVLTTGLVSKVYGVRVDAFPHPDTGHTIFDFSPEPPIGVA